MVLGVEDVVDLTGHPLLGNDLLPVRPGVVPVPLPVKPQGQLANLTACHWPGRPPMSTTDAQRAHTIHKRSNTTGVLDNIVFEERV